MLEEGYIHNKRTKTVSSNLSCHCR